MYNYPVEKNGIRFYKYKFLGMEDRPVTVEAFNRKQAKIVLRDFILQNADYHNIPIINESTWMPVFGESTKVIHDIECVWVGNGKWIPLWEYKQWENKNL